MAELSMLIPKKTPISSGPLKVAAQTSVTSSKIDRSIGRN